MHSKDYVMLGMLAKNNNQSNSQLSEEFIRAIDIYPVNINNELLLITLM